MREDREDSVRNGAHSDAVVVLSFVSVVALQALSGCGCVSCSAMLLRVCGELSLCVVS